MTGTIIAAAITTLVLPNTESESESEAAAVDTESTDDSLDVDDLPLANFLEETNTENTEDNIPIAVMAPNLRPIKFQWEKKIRHFKILISHYNFQILRSQKFTPIDYFKIFFSNELCFEVTSQMILYSQQNKNYKFSISENELNQL